MGLRPDEEQSPGVLQKMIQAAVRNGSYREGSRELAESAELTIDPKKLERAVHRIGGERLAERDAEVATWQKLSLPEQQGGCPEGKVPPSLAVVQFDCGRMLIRERTTAAEGPAAAVETGEAVTEVAMQTAQALAEDEAAWQAASAAEPRESASGSEATNGTPQTEATNGESRPEQADGQSPTEASSAASTVATVPGDKNATPDACRSRFWRDSKVGVLLTMKSVEHQEDPCPEIPASFLDPQRMVKLVGEMGHVRGCQEKEKASEKPSAEGEKSRAGPTRPGAPQPLVKSIVASRAKSNAFGAILAAAAWARGFAGAPRKAFLGDGAAMNWTLWACFFSQYVPILDFIHALQYVFAAAMAGCTFDEGWPVYRRWIQAVWSGRVGEVIAELRERQVKLGLPGSEAPATDPRRVVATTLHYLETHQERMDYARYRRLGLPIMTAYVESAVKQVSRRVKGTEKFWSEAGAEAILQLRADYLSETAPLDGFWDRRKERATGQRSYRRAASKASNHCAV